MLSIQYFWLTSEIYSNLCNKVFHIDSLLILFYRCAKLFHRLVNCLHSATLLKLQFCKSFCAKNDPLFGEMPFGERATTTVWKPRNMINMINKIMFAKMVFDDLHSREQHGNFLKRKRVESVLLRWAVQRSSWAKEGVQHRFSHKSDISNLRLAQTSICLVWREKSSFPCWECTWPWPHSKSKDRSRNYPFLRTTCPCPKW